MSGTIATGSAPAARRPARRRASPRGRSRRTRPTTRDGRPTRRTASPTGSRRRGASQVSRGMSSNGRRSARRAPGGRSVRVGEGLGGPGTGGLRVEGGSGHRREDSIESRDGCDRNLGPSDHSADAPQAPDYPDACRLPPDGAIRSANSFVARETRLFLTATSLAVRRAAAHPLDPGQRHLRRLLQELPADGELPRHRRRHPVGPRPERLPISPFGPLLLATRRPRHAVPASRSRLSDPDEIFFGLSESSARRHQLPRPAGAGDPRDGHHGGARRAARAAADLDAAAQGVHHRHRGFDDGRRALHGPVGGRDAADRLVQRRRPCLLSLMGLGTGLGRRPSSPRWSLAGVLCRRVRRARRRTRRWSPYYRIDRVLRRRHLGRSTSTASRTRRCGRSSGTLDPFYEQVYRWFPDRTYERVLIVGAGSGTDVAVALKHGARHVDAVEIDPKLQEIGVRDHPNRPYDDPRVDPHHRRRAGVPAPHHREVRPGRVRAAGFPHAGEHVRQPAPGVVPVHVGGVRRRPGPPHRRRHLRDVQLLPRGLAAAEDGGDARGQLRRPADRAAYGRSRGDPGAGPAVRALDGGPPPGRRRRPDGPRRSSRSRPPTTGPSSTCASGSSRRTTSRPWRSSSRSRCCSSGERRSGAGRRSASSARTSSSWASRSCCSRPRAWRRSACCSGRPGS